MSVYRASGSLRLGNAGNQSCIQLQFAVQSQMRILLMCDTGSFYYFVNQCVLCTSLGGVAQHGDHGLRSDQRLEASGRSICDSSQFFGSRILVQTTVSEQEGSVLTLILEYGIHNEECGYQFNAGCSLQDLQCRS